MRTNRTDVIYFVQCTGRIGISLTQNIQLLSIYSFADTQSEWKYTSTPVFLRFKICHCKCRFYLPTTTITTTSFFDSTSTTTTIDMDIFNTLSLFTRDIQVFCLSLICLQTTATSSKDRLFTTFNKYFTNTGLNFYNETELEKPSINWLIYFNCNCVYYIFKFLNYTDIFSVCHFLFHNHKNFDQTIQLKQKCYEENSSTISLKCCLFC